MRGTPEEYRMKDGAEDGTYRRRFMQEEVHTGGADRETVQNEESSTHPPALTSHRVQIGMRRGARDAAHRRKCSMQESMQECMQITAGGDVGEHADWNRSKGQAGAHARGHIYLSAH